MLQTEGRHLELQTSHRSQHRGGVAQLGIAQHLNHAFFVELGDAPPELLETPGVQHPGPHEELGREAGDGREGDRRPGRVVEGVPDAHVGGVDQANHVAGVGLLHRLALLAEHGGCVLGVERLAGAPLGDDHASFETAGADPNEGNAIAVGGVHVGLDLEHEAGEMLLQRPAFALGVEAGLRRGDQFHHRVEQLAHPEVCHGRAEKGRGGFVGQERFDVQVGADLGQQLDLLLGGFPGQALFPGRSLRVDDLFRGNLRASSDAGVAGVAAVAPIQDAPEVTGETDRPGHRNGG